MLTGTYFSNLEALENIELEVDEGTNTLQICIFSRKTSADIKWVSGFHANIKKFSKHSPLP